MTVTTVNLRSNAKESGNALPKRSMDAYKVTMDGDTDTGWINKEFLAILTLGIPARHAGLTAKIYGRYKLNGTPDAATETLISEKDGTDKVLALDTHASEGSTFVIDEAAPFDQVKAVISGAMTGVLLFGFGA